MSRGLSTFQQKVVTRLEERGVVDLFDLVTMTEAPDLPPVVRAMRRSIWASERAHVEGECRCESRRDCRGERRIRSIRNVAGLYRAMASLERRGLAAAVLNHQPRTWVRVIWPDGSDAPAVPREAFQKCSTRLILKVREGWTLRTRGGLFRIPPEPGGRG